MSRTAKRNAVIVNLLIVCILMIVIFDTDCKDPYEYEPPEDTLLTPPGPPLLVYPRDNFVFMDPAALPGASFAIHVQLDWQPVEHAELYELELTTDTLPPNTIYCDSDGWYFLIQNDNTKLCDYFWRVRAYSSDWQYFTEYTAQRRFEARWRPFAPQQLYPLYNGIIHVDSLPAQIDFVWFRTQDEEFYELNIFRDNVLVNYSIVPDTHWLEIVSDTGLYTWQVRAGSQCWQYASFWSPFWNFTVIQR
ncbi:hypothetical protein AMJ83_07120 [candidate division WOR_3 bacterium SM23_42]|uniref:Fibronectin type-III domain-containing protein n=1 Tax=candidate division WOR_3 bacterium SM23_42 TaxID=1703779 RepID=A0A0S8FRT7_UNCW3|nr:MAG: hypothetical protein AMJ83_07120 [candidate division WOR_3 bacterium SM23_42]